MHESVTLQRFVVLDKKGVWGASKICAPHPTLRTSHYSLRIILQKSDLLIMPQSLFQ